MSNREKVIDRIGKTSFPEWISLIQHSVLTIGNDSASIHIAAACRVPSICLVGLYDKNQFFPYSMEDINGKKVLPKAIMSKANCEYCRTIHYFAGYGNNRCKRQIKSGKAALCISNISVLEVLKVIDEEISTLEL